MAANRMTVIAILMAMFVGCSGTERGGTWDYCWEKGSNLITVQLKNGPPVTRLEVLFLVENNMMVGAPSVTYGPMITVSVPQGADEVSLCGTGNMAFDLESKKLGGC